MSQTGQAEKKKKSSSFEVPESIQSLKQCHILRTNTIMMFCNCMLNAVLMVIYIYDILKTVLRGVLALSWLRSVLFSQYDCETWILVRVDMTDIGIDEKLYGWDGTLQFLVCFYKMRNSRFCLFIKCEVIKCRLSCP